MTSIPTPENRSPKTHSLAVIALVCSLVLCCPITSLLGVIFGWFSMRAIDASEGRLRGRKLAIWAIIVGLVMLPIQFLLLDRFETSVDQQINSGLEKCVARVFDIDAPDRAKLLQQTFVAVRGKYPTPEEADAFAKSVTEQLGAYRSVSIIQRSMARDSFLQTNLQLALVFTFENGTVTGGADADLVPTPPSVWPDVRLRLLEIDLPENQTVQIPEAAQQKKEQDDSTDQDAPALEREGAQE